MRHKWLFVRVSGKPANKDRGETPSQKYGIPSEYENETFVSIGRCGLCRHFVQLDASDSGKRAGGVRMLPAGSAFGPQQSH
jgi:hypothetical protein